MSASTLRPYGGERLVEPDPERRVRFHVHVALAGALLAFVGPVVTWALWLADRHAPAGRWKRRLLALAILDTALVLGLAAARAQGVELEGGEHEPPRIGVALATGERPGGAVVESVAPGSPAARADLHAGDRIVAIDGTAVADDADLVRAIAGTPTGGARRLTVLRDAETLDATIVPEIGAPEPVLSPRALFTAPRGVERSPPGHRFVIGAGTLQLALVVGLTVTARRRHARIGPGLGVLFALLALAITSSTVLYAFQVTLGPSLGALLVAIVSGSVALLAIGLVAARAVGLDTLRVEPAIRTRRAIALGVLYGAAGGARVAAVVALAAAALHLPLQGAASAFGLDRSWGTLGIGLFLVGSVVVAPLGEELLFRGVLLPWLARWMGPASALGWSTLLFTLGHLYYGLGAAVIALYGLILGWARLRTGKLWASIALHAILNGTTAAALLAHGAR